MTPYQTTPGLSEREELLDKIDGLQSDLDAAVEVAFERGAVEWTRRNYPALYQRLAARKEAPADWVLVPREPTEAMLTAGNKKLAEGCTVGVIYRAMIAAAPQGPVEPRMEGE